MKIEGLGRVGKLNIVLIKNGNGVEVDGLLDVHVGVVITSCDIIDDFIDES